MAEGGNEIKTGDSHMEVNECLASWLTYLQRLNGLCTAGTKLALSLQTLLSIHNTNSQCQLTGQCLAGWEGLTRATSVATNTVKNHVVVALKDHEILENAGDKHDILRDNLLTFINLQYQFCVACCENLSGMADCSCLQVGNAECDIAALQQCFERLYSSPPPIATSQQTQQNCHRSPLPYPLFPLQVQRRWSETAAGEMSGESAENTVRRWSMPWEMRTRLKVPLEERSSSSSQDGLREAIQLLSCKPGIRPSNQLSNFASQHIPGYELRVTSYENSIWPDARPTGHRDSDQSGRDSEYSGASGSDYAGTTDVLTSRKSSSSTDSCMSAHSRSGSESAGAGECARSQLYSMWSGGDLPFIKLTESTEVRDEHPPV
ncbi:uncharacterized protein LOC117177447 [Belonocnema kinseyi]|uniref:uncharacterized protein LOC117177447 n=1 Tax=Belonocnema kinseyi TaxID=2817044 RepID=UPI00143D87D9|nr:uncharacterized protein LOC117177447 [Belonocnema kinseyi]XP_033224032.1 uncharacterized protein LOC117177447 [Belonocnema kinseyi]XP_033224033.1 uncharacterized protein LOC117177447 [Belonocnema kinseyi]